MVLHVSLSISFNNMEDWKGIWEKAEEVNSMADFPLNSEHMLH
jgi:hypothetical protein